jgi:hypothetical protein
MHTVPVYIRQHGGTANVAIEEPGCFVLKDALGRDWLCVESSLPEIPEDLGPLFFEQTRLQTLAHKHGLSVEGNQLVM